MATPPLSYFKRSLFLLWLSHLFVDFFTGIWPIYKTLAGIDIAEAGFIAGVTGFLGESFQIIFGNLCDRGHRKKIMLLGLVLTSSILWITFCKSSYSFFLVLFLLMLGSGSFHPAAAGMAGSLSRIYKGRTILFFASGGAIGLGISQITFARLIHHFDGHAIIALLPVFAVFVLLALHPFPQIKNPLVPTSLKKFFEPLKPMRKPLTLLYFSQVFNQAIVMSFMFMLPDLLYARGCHSWLCLGGGHLCFILGSAITMFPAGILCDRHGQKAILITVLISALTLFYFFLSQTNLSLTSTGLLLASLGAFLGIINPIIVSWGNRLVPDHSSTVSALLMGFAWCFGNLGPMLAGTLAKLFISNGYMISLSLMGVLILGTLLLVTAVPKELPTAELTLDSQDSL